MILNLLNELGQLGLEGIMTLLGQRPSDLPPPPRLKVWDGQVYRIWDGNQWIIEK